MSRNKKVFYAVCAVLPLIALVGAAAFSMGARSSSSAKEPSSATSVVDGSVINTTVASSQEVSSATTEPEPISTNFTVTSVQYPLVETPQNTNPPELQPDLGIQFSDTTAPQTVQKLKEICPLTFHGTTKFCVEVDIFTDSEDPYKASVEVGIRNPAPGCSDFTDCFGALKGSTMCTSFLGYLDALVRDLVTHGYNAYGLNNLNPALVKPTYWDVAVENRQIEFGSDCSVVVSQR